MAHVIRLTKQFSFEAAHAIEGYDGPCREIHGHSYKLYVTVKGEPESDERSPKFGMVMDFGELKRIVGEQVVKPFDHAFMLRRSPENGELYDRLRDRFERIVLLDFQPTTENLLAEFARRIQRQLPEGVKLHALKLHETETSYGEWFAEDN